MAEDKAKLEAELELLNLEEEELKLQEQLKGAMPIGIDEPQSPEESSGFIRSATNLMDIAGAPARSAIMGEGTEFLSKIPEQGLNVAIEEAPSGKEIAAQKLGLSTQETMNIGDFTFSPAGMAGIPIEMATDPFSWVSPKKLTEPFKLAMRAGGRRQAAKVIAKELTSSNVLKEGMDPEVIANQVLSEEGIYKLLDKPKALKKKLRGSSKVDETQVGGISGFERSRQGGGLIGEAAEQTTKMLEDVSPKLAKEGAGIKRNALPTIVSNRFSKQMTDSLGVEFDAKKIKEIEQKIARKFLKLTDESGLPNVPHITVSELHKMKKELGSRINSKTFYKGADEAVQLEKQIDREAIRAIDELIMAELDGVTVQVGKEIVDASQFYAVNNARQSALLKLSSILEDADYKNLKKDDIIAMLRGGAAMTTIGGALGAMTEYPIAGMVLGGAFSAVHAVQKAATKTSPYASMRWFKRLEDATDPMAQMAPQVQRMMTQPPYRTQEDRFGRSPDSVGRAMDEAAEEVMNTPLPRDVEQILADPKFMLMKVAQMNPEAYDQINHLLTKRPDLLRSSFPMLVNAMPQLFELDEYNRINGKIMDPQLRIKAEQDLWKRDDIPVDAKVEINDMLNKDGSYPL